MIVMPLVIMMIESDEDRSYMERLYEQHHRLMLSTAWKYTSDQFEVEDIVSDSIVALIRKIDQLRHMEKSALRCYIVSTVRNTSINHFKKEKGLNERFVLAGDELASHIVEPDSIVHKIVLHDELMTIIQVIHTLSPKEQTVLRMKCFENMSNDEIAQATGLAHESIRKYLSRAREKIRNAIYEEGSRH